MHPHRPQHMAYSFCKYHTGGTLREFTGHVAVVTSPETKISGFVLLLTVSWYNDSTAFSEETSVSLLFAKRIQAASRHHMGAQQLILAFPLARATRVRPGCF